jgi:hypothetical protein
MKDFFMGKHIKLLAVQFTYLKETAKNIDRQLGDVDSFLSQGNLSRSQQKFAEIFPLLRPPGVYKPHES